MFHATLLRQYQETDVYGANFPRPPPNIIEGEEVYKVEWILKHQKQGRGYQYYVAWKGYPISEASWEPEQVFSDNGDLLTNYKIHYHLWLLQLWSNCLSRPLKIWKWNKHGDWMTAWTKPDKLGNSLNGIKTMWQPRNSQKPLSPSFCIPLAKTSKWFINRMSTSFNSRSPSSSQDKYPLLTSAKVSQLLLDQEMNFAVSTAFSSSPLSTVLLQQYLFLSHNLKWIWQDLTRRQLEWESIFDVLSHSTPFQDIITPIILNFRLRQWQVSPVNPPTTFQTSSYSPTSEHIKTRQLVVIQERSNSNDSLLSFYTPAHNEPGTRNNPINVDWLLNPSPSPPQTPVYTPPRTRSAPVTAPCPMCCWHSHTSTQCVWYSPGICSYCNEVGHTQHTYNILRHDQQWFNPHLLYCLMCQQSGHISSYHNTLPSYQ